MSDLVLRTGTGGDKTRILIEWFDESMVRHTTQIDVELSHSWNAEKLTVKVNGLPVSRETGVGGNVASVDGNHLAFVRNPCDIKQASAENPAKRQKSNLDDLCCSCHFWTPGVHYCEGDPKAYGRCVLLHQVNRIEHQQVRNCWFWLKRDKAR